MSRKRQRVAIVTGASSGLGCAVVERLAEEGYAVAMADIDSLAGESKASALEDQGRRVRFFPADVTRSEECVRLVREVQDAFSHVDCLVNAAGIIDRAASVDVTEAQLRRVQDVNLNGTIFMCQAVHSCLVQRGGGEIVNFASMLAHYGSRNLLAYASSKGGVVQVTKCLAVEWAEDNICVNAVSPGYIETPLAAGATRDPVFRERILSRTPQRRFGTPEEVAAAVEFLLSGRCRFITGVVLPVDGGLLAGDPALFPPVGLAAHFRERE